ncbi:MAG TPA: Ig-like domain-containing protein, partial [Bryobacteraceae bacterium]|nr:Ig-like domain-containing protein [Bryobacteraceae bacterium]
NVTPSSVTLGASQTQQFAAAVANVSNGNMAVTWTVAPSGVGAVDSTGPYTAPAAISGTETISVTATSVANRSMTASATVTLAPPQ